jgi:translocation and assembly module TamB
MELNMKNGVMSLSHFRLDGDQSFIEVKGTNFTRENLALNLDSKANLRLFHIFLPFFEEFGGMAMISVAISGPLMKPQILGTANAENAFVKLKGFPHPFEKIQTDIQFSASKVLINNFTGNIAGGSFKGDGGISIEGPKNLPMNITAHVDSANLNVPEGVRTLGDADLSFSGNWFPFLLSGTYRVKSGMISKEFGEEATNGVLQQSSYLPKVILQSAFEPILLDIQVQLDNGINIKNSLVEGVLTGQLQIKGPPAQPILYGKIIIAPHSKLFSRDKIFDVSAGTLTFKDPNEINPELYMLAHTRVTDYDISLVAQGTAKSSLLRFTSIPPLSEPDIISLLALGVLTAKSDNRLHSLQSNNDNQTSATAIGSAILSSTRQGRKIQDNLGVNLQLSNSYDDTKNVAVQKITLSKKIREKVNLSASRIQGQQNSNEFKIRYNFNNHVSAVGTYEERQPSEDARAVSDSLKKSESILGIDLEYKKEFK